MLKDILAAPGPGRQRLQRFPDGEVAQPPLRLQVLTKKRPRYLKKPAVNFAGFFIKHKALNPGPTMV